MKEQFDPEDEKYWDDKCTSIENFVRDSFYFRDKCRGDVNLTNQTDIDIPTIAFSYLIRDLRPEYAYLFPYNVSVKYFDGNDDTYWLKDSGYLGLHFEEDDRLEIQLKRDHRHSKLSLLWLLLHEFRHKIQNQVSSIKTNVDNDNPNLKLLIEYLLEKSGSNRSMVDHVFHEIMPIEIDANTFACELLEIDYPSSKFAMTQETLSFLSHD